MKHQRERKSGYGCLLGRGQRGIIYKYATSKLNSGGESGTESKEISPNRLYLHDSEYDVARRWRCSTVRLR
jgi:hypothetical protein